MKRLGQIVLVMSIDFWTFCDFGTRHDFGTYFESCIWYMVCLGQCRGGLWTFWEAHSVPVVMEASFVTLYRAAEDVWLDLQELNETSSTFS